MVYTELWNSTPHHVSSVLFHTALYVLASAAHIPYCPVLNLHPYAKTDPKSILYSQKKIARVKGPVACAWSDTHFPHVVSSVLVICFH